MKVRIAHGNISSELTVRGLPKKLVDEIVANATFPNPEYESISKYGDSRFSDVHETVSFAWFYRGELTMTRGAVEMMPKRIYDKLMNLEWGDTRTRNSAKFPELRPGLSLVKEQQDCMNALQHVVYNGFRPFGNLLFVASTSVGKTILMACAASKLGQKTLVLCPTNLIMRAWQDDLKKAFNFTSKDIGIIKQKKWDIRDCITLASIQTLGRRQSFWPDLNEEIGTVVVDEVQGVSAPTVYEFLSQSPACWFVGATATIQNRDGGRNIYLESLFGKPIIEVNTYHKETATSLRISEFKLVNTNFRYSYQSDNLDWHDLADHLTGDEERNALIIENAKKDWLEKKIVLVVTKRVEHVALLQQMAIEAGITNVNTLTGTTNTNRFYTGKLLELLAKRKISFVIATIQAVKLGANIPVLDSLHLAMPPANQRDLEQLFGRIRRKEKDKTEASITYYFDQRIRYMALLYRKTVVPVLRKMRIPGYENMFVV
jgi:superfamily II DNA or RNA helicase